MEVDENAYNKKRKASTEHDGAAKRKRVSRACDRCRTKKDKCDGQRPSCSACVASSQVCSYDPNTKKRGLPEGYVRGLEKLWAVAIGKIEGLEDAVTSIIAHQEVLEIWNHEAVGEDLHSVWKDSIVLQELEGMLARLESANSSSGMKKRREKDNFNVDDAADSEFHRTLLYHVEEGAASLDSEPASPLTRREDTQLSPLTRKLNPKETPLPPQTSKLIETYFSFTHCWFPILERHRVIRTVYSHSRSRKPSQSDSDTADLAALWAILAYTAHQTMLTRVEGDESQVITDSVQAEMIRTARALIPGEDCRFEIGHVQALLLLTLLDIGLGKWSSGWIVCGKATRMALELGHGNEVTDTRTIHVLYGCFFLDTLIASHLLRPPHLRRQDLEAIGYLEEDGDEEWNPWTSSRASSSYQDPAFTMSCFNRLLDVFMILNDTVCDKRVGLDRLAYFQSLADQLKGLPSRFPMFPGLQCPPHQLYLQLFHLSTSILVLRQCFEGGAPSDSLAPLAWEVLVLLSKYAQDPTSGLTTVPPVLENVVRSACYAAIAAKPSFESHAELPSYHDFARRMTDYMLEMSAVWPVFSGLTKLWQKELQSQKSTGDFSATTRNKNGSTFVWSNPPGDLQNQYSGHMLQQTIRDAGGGLNVELEGFDVSMSGLEQPVLNTSIEQSSMPAGLSMPASDHSPSFQGDDVDVIFHNLAYLDTTDWTNDRQQGLQEFGFADESTFQDFCNDPERMVPSGDTTFGLLSDASTATFWPPPGFFPAHFEAPDPQVEASQILQSLSNNDAYPTLPEGVGW